MKRELVLCAADKADPSLRSKAGRLATISSCCGFLGEVTLTDSAVIILFAGMLGAGDMLSLMTTSILSLLNGLCVIPMAWIASRIGARTLIIRSCALASVAYFLSAASPFFGGAAAPFLLAMIALFSLCFTGLVAGWLPLLDSFLRPDDRVAFLGRMRFCHQATAAIFLFAVGLLIGREPSLFSLQLVLLAGATAFAARILFVSKMPVFAERKAKAALNFKEGLLKAIGNRPLACFSVYLFVLNLAACGTVPLAMVYLKKSLLAPDNVVVMISAFALAGMLLGYLSGRALIGRLKVKGSLLLFHCVFALANFALFMAGTPSTCTYVAIGAILTAYNFAVAGASVVSSAEMMAMSSPENKTMDIALGGAFFYGGCGLSRMLSSLVLGSGALAAQWSFGAVKICQYQTLFLVYAGAVVFAAAFLVIVPSIFPVKADL